MFVSTGADTPVLYGNPKNLVSAVFIGISAMYVPIIIKTKMMNIFLLIDCGVFIILKFYENIFFRLHLYWKQETLEKKIKKNN